VAPALITAILAVLIWAVTAAAAHGTLSANGLIGIRTPATQRSEEAWRASHRAALRLLTPTSLVVAIAGLIVALVPPVTRSVGEAGGLVLLGVYVLALIGAGVIAHRAAQRSSTATGEHDTSGHRPI